MPIVDGRYPVAKARLRVNPEATGKLRKGVFARTLLEIALFINPLGLLKVR